MATTQGPAGTSLADSDSPPRGAPPAPHWDVIPAELAQRPQWLLWKFESKPGQKKPAKVPYYAGGGRRTGDQGSERDRGRLTTLAAVRQAYERGGWSGVGFAFLPGDGLVGIDIDNAVDPESGQPTARCAAIIEACASFTERSVSGRGVHIYGLGQTTTNKSNDIGLELFCERQFFIVTGDAWPDTPADVQPIAPQALARLHATIDETKGRRGRADDAVPRPMRAPQTPEDLRSRVESALAAISPDLGYNDWISIGWALREAFGDFGFGLWAAWSARSAKYQGEQDLKAHWPSFKVQSSPDEAVAVIFARATESGWKPPRASKPAAVIPIQQHRRAAEALDTATVAQALDDGLPPGTELELAKRFGEALRGSLRWSPGLDWLRNAGTHWERDLLLTRFNAAKDICRAAASEADSPKIATRIGTASTVNAILSLARAEDEMATPASEWDRDTMVLNTPGPAIDLETGKEVSRNGLLFTQLTTVAPERRKAERWAGFLREVFGGDAEMIEFIQRLAGYSLTGSIREQKLFFLHGSGANGKSVFLDMLRAVGGSYAYNLPAEALMSTRHSGHPTMLASLRGKRLAVSSEVEEGSHWSEARIKSLTGDETLTARYMRQDFFEFRQTAKHLVSGNYRPRLRGDDYAMTRRLVLIPFNQRFEGERRDDHLLDKLKAELPGVLQWAVDGAVKWARDGLAIPSSVLDASRQYASEQNDLELWIADCCRRDPAASAGAKPLYDSFRRWKEASGERAPSTKSFSQRLERMFSKRKTRAGMVFEGLRLADGSDDYALECQ
jgi:putative DNA primase/helicase